MKYQKLPIGIFDFCPAVARVRDESNTGQRFWLVRNGSHHGANDRTARVARYDTLALWLCVTCDWIRPLAASQPVDRLLERSAHARRITDALHSTPEEFRVSPDTDSTGWWLPALRKDIGSDHDVLRRHPCHTLLWTVLETIFLEARTLALFRCLRTGSSSVSLLFSS